MDGTLRGLERRANAGDAGELVLLARALARTGERARALELLLERLEAPEARAALRALGTAPPPSRPREALRIGTRSSEWSAPRTLDLAGSAVVVVERGERPTAAFFDPRDGRFLHGRGLAPGTSLDLAGGLLITTTPTDLLAHDAWTGERAWSWPVEPGARAWPGEGLLAAVRGDGWVELLDLAGPAPALRARFALAGRRLLAVASWAILATSEVAGRPWLHALALDDGTERWRVPVGSRRLAFDEAGVVHDTPGGEELELRTPEGALRWRRPARGVPTLTAAAVVVADRTAVVALDRRDGASTALFTGHVAQPITAGGDLALVVEASSNPWGKPPRPPVLTEEQRVLADARRSPADSEWRDARLLAIDVRTGRRRWSYTLGWRDQLQLALHADRLLLLEEGGALVLLR